MKNIEVTSPKKGDQQWVGCGGLTRKRGDREVKGGGTEKGVKARGGTGGKVAGAKKGEKAGVGAGGKGGGS